MDSKDWIRIAKLVEKSLNDPHVKGVIISHGTDFLHYTGAALSFMLGKLNKPVVLTYSQRSSDRGSADSRLNLICSAHMALADVSEVMLVGHANSDDDYCYALQGNKCRKMHTSRRDTFRPINCKPIAKVFEDGKIEMIRSNVSKRGDVKGKIKVDSLYDLVTKSEQEMLKYRNFGRKSLNEINEILSGMDLSFGMSFEEEIRERVEVVLASKA